MLAKTRFTLLVVSATLLIVGVVSWLTPEKEGMVFLQAVPVEGSVLRRVAYISGEVENPGVYPITESMRLADLLLLAGGTTTVADSDYVARQLNLAKLLEDEQHVFIPTKVQSVPGAAVAGPTTPLSNLVSINNSSPSELDSLPGIGPATAAKIIESRPFSKVEDLLNVSGIGESKFNSIKSLISL